MHETWMTESTLEHKAVEMVGKKNFGNIKSISY